MVGTLKDLTHSTQLPMYVLSGILVVGALAGVADAREDGQTR